MRKLRLVLQATASFVFAWAAIHLLSPGVEAQITTPSMADGSYSSTADAPCIPFHVGPATGTTQIEARTSGPGYVSWVAVSTHATAAYAILRDTGTASNTGIQQWVRFNAATGQSTVYTLRPPAKFTNGITVENSAAGLTTTVCTRLYGTSTP